MDKTNAENEKENTKNLNFENKKINTNSANIENTKINIKNESKKNKEKADITKFKTVSIFCVAMLMLIYEVGYCNLKTIVMDHSYNLSFVRIAIYGIVVILLAKFGNSMAEKAANTFPKKKKIIFLLAIFSLIFDLLQFNRALKAQNVNKFYELNLILLAEINAFLFVMYISKDQVNNIIVTVMTFGIFFTYSMPFNHQIDEKTHFLECLNFSVGNFDLSEGHALTDTAFDKITRNMTSTNFAMNFFDEKCNFNMTTLSFDDRSNEPSGYRTPIAYIPGTIGILFARIFGGSIADVFICGRLMNILTFGMLLVIMFKILPYKKKTFYFTYLIPLSLALSATYTTDGITIGLIGIFMAYVLKLYNENREKISMKEFMILCLTYLLVLSCKNASYMGIGFLVFILPLKKYFKNNKKMFIITLALVALVIVIGISVLEKNVSTNLADDRAQNANSALQFAYIKEKPSRLLDVYINYIERSFIRLSWYINLNSSYFFGNEADSVEFGLFILGLYASYIDTSKNFENRARLIMAITFCLTFFITSFPLYLLYTKAGSDTISGYQARYIISFLPLILMLLSSRKRIDKNYKSESVFDGTALALGTLTFIDMLSQILILN